MSERCVNDMMGFCNPDAEFAVESCPFGKTYVEEHYNWHLKRGEKIVDAMPTLILHDGLIQCTAEEGDLIDMHDDCFHCDGTPEYDGEFCCCPEDYPDDCPRTSCQNTEKSRVQPVS